MQTCCVRKGRHAGRAVVAAAAALCAVHLLPGMQPLASGITIRDDRLTDPQWAALAANAKYDSVASVYLDLSGTPTFFGSSTIISPKWVLTAAHLTDTTFNQTRTVRLNNVDYVETRHFAYYGWNPADLPEIKLTAGTDIGLIQLSTPVTSITPASRLFGNINLNPDLNQLAVSVGYGNSGTGTSGDNGTGTLASQIKRAAENDLDRIGGNPGFTGYNSNIIFSDFDNPAGTASHMGSAQPENLEGLIAHGDSGGGTFIQPSGGRSYIAAVHSFLSRYDATDNASYSDIGGSTRVLAYNAWIDERTANNWDSSIASGGFGDNANWKLGTDTGAGGNYSTIAAAPVQYDIAGFNTATNVTATFSSNVENWALLARSGNTTLNFGGFAYTLTSPLYDGSVVVGRYSGNTATMTFTNGTINSKDVILGQMTGASGQVILGTVGNAGTWNVTGDVYLGGTFSAAGGSGTIDINNNSSVMNISGRLKLYANGRVNYNAGSLSVATLDFKGGRVNLSLGGNKILQTQSVSFDPILSGKLDLSDNDMIVNYTGGSPLSSTILPAIVSGYAGGLWNGNGILSSAAEVSPIGTGRTAIGYGEAGPSGLNIDNFGGIAVDNDAILLKYTYIGDTNLDGMVDRADLGRFAQGWQHPGTWMTGDFNYDGVINIMDLAMLLKNWMVGTGGLISPPEPLSAILASYNLPSDIGTSIPEPAGLGALLALALPLGRRRRK